MSEQPPYPLGTRFSIQWAEYGLHETYIVDSEKHSKGFRYLSPEEPLGYALLSGALSCVVDGKAAYYSIVKMDIPGQIKQKDLSFQPEVYKTIKSALTDDFINKSVISTPALDEKDQNLALEWYKGQKIQNENNDNTIIFLGQKVKYSELARMLSARAAEKAAMQFFKNTGIQNITDVSIQQLANQGLNENWRQCDLIVDGAAYDVKNSRFSNSRDRSYTEHCIPRYKQVRGTPVQILGVASHYLPVEEMLAPDRIANPKKRRVQILGFAEEKCIEKLQQYFRPNLEIDFTHSKGEKFFLPAWIFDYPEAYYSKRKQAFDQLAILFRTQKYVKERQIPAYLALGREPSFLGLNQITFLQKDFITCWFQAQKELGLSLPVLFLTILSHFLKVVSSTNSGFQSYSPSQYSGLIYSVDEYTNPLFLFDPLETVNGLIKSLDELWNQKSKEILKYSSFRLISLGILRGRLKTDPQTEKSLVAYCGGCGKTPLVLGKQEHCSCSMLICDKCGYCFEHCPEFKARQDSKLNESGSYVADKDEDDETPF